MKLSARNVLRGVVTKVVPGAVNGVVTISLGDAAVRANITMEAIKELGLEPGKKAYAIVKSSNVLVASGNSRVPGISASTQLFGTVNMVRPGAVVGHVAIELADGNVITSRITNESIAELGLEVGAPAIAIVKSTDVIVGID